MQPTTFVRWLKKLRAEQDLTQEMLAELIGCATHTLSALETGARRPSREMAERIADVLRVPADQRAEFLRLARQSRAEQPITEPSVTVSPPPLEQPTPRYIPPPLPPVATALIGREAERNALQNLICDAQNRLVTIVGAGGMGKTRLALDLTAHLQEQFTDGAAFVALAAISQMEHLPGAIANSLNIPLQGSTDLQQQLNTWLASRHMLLTLDNFEQLLSEAASIEWVRQWLNAAPRLQLLITSRERLRVSGERVFELNGLTLPQPHQSSDEADAALLFLERAQQTASDFVLDSSNRVAVNRICHLVEGMPLGIELAAAWVNILTPDEIAEEISRSIDFLALAQRDMTPRHRSMRAVIDHSWRLLGAEERSVLMKLAVFRGGCTREAVQQVAGATLPILANLIDKSLLRRSQTTPTRYTLHELVRQYAEDRLRTEPTIAATLSEVHAAYYHQLVRIAERQLWGANIADALSRLDTENDNVRVALEHYLAQPTGVEASINLAGSLWRFWEMRGAISEGRSWLGRALQRGSDPPAPSRWLALHAAGNLAGDQGDYAYAKECYQESLRLLQSHLPTLADPEQIRTTHYRIANTLTNLGNNAIQRGNLAEALPYCEEALALNRRLETKVGLALTLTNLATIYLWQQQLDQAEHWGREALATYQELGDERGIAWNLSRLGNIACERGLFAQAASLFREARMLYEKLADQADLVWLDFDEGELARAQGEDEQAETHYQAGIRLAQQLSNKRATALLLDRLSLIASHAGHHAQAVTWNDQSIALHRAIGNELGLSEALHHREQITAALANSQ